MGFAWLGQIAVSVVISIVVYVLMKYALEPVDAFHQIVRSTAEDLYYWAFAYMNPGVGKPEVLTEASRDLRRRASQLTAQMMAIHPYDFWAFLRLVPSEKALLAAVADLTGLSNSLGQQGEGGENGARRDRIRSNLRIPW